MSRLTLYLDEVDVLTTQEAVNIGLHDVGQLTFAVENRRSFFSYDKRHFARIHYDMFFIIPFQFSILLCFPTVPTS